MPMTQGAPDSPVRGTTGHEFYETMSDTNRARGEKRGVLGTVVPRSSTRPRTPTRTPLTTTNRMRAETCPR